MLKNIVVVDESETTSDKVTLGKTVRVRNESNGKEYVYNMVGSTEADPFANRISNLSPIGAALIGAKEGDRVTATGTPKGAVDYTILEIKKTGV